LSSLVVVAGMVSEWYRCTITLASANRDTWDVLYDDGDEGIELCRTCVRTFTPYAVTETLYVRVSDDEYAPCHVVAIHRQGKLDVYDVQLEDDEAPVILNVPTKDLRRVGRDSDATPLPVRTRVMAVYRDESGGAEYYPGTIEQYNVDQNTYVIYFDDGDYLYNVPRRDIALL
jgi:Histone methyltransferase Tudor domain 1